MKYNPNIHHRRSIRLKGYDYAQEGLYFITFCVQNRAPLFGKIEDRKMILNPAGQMIAKEWEALPDRFDHIALHEYIIMPNHFHSILEIAVRAPLVGAPTIGLGEPRGEGIGQPQGEGLGRPQGEGLGQPQGVAPTVRNGNPQGVAPTIRNGNQRGVAPTIGDEKGISSKADTGENKRIALGNILGAFKSVTTHKYIQGVKEEKWPYFDKRLWQRNYYEHIIRDHNAYLNISAYIINNPAKWKEDRFCRL
jgi:putative transposase